LVEKDFIVYLQYAYQGMLNWSIENYLLTQRPKQKGNDFNLKLSIFSENSRLWRKKATNQPSDVLDWFWTPQNRGFLAKTTTCGRRGQGEDLVFIQQLFGP
jgi:hypothetical protein